MKNKLKIHIVISVLLETKELQLHEHVCTAFSKYSLTLSQIEGSGDGTGGSGSGGGVGGIEEGSGSIFT